MWLVSHLCKIPDQAYTKDVTCYIPLFDKPGTLILKLDNIKILGSTQSMNILDIFHPAQHMEEAPSTSPPPHHAHNILGASEEPISMVKVFGSMPLLHVHFAIFISANNSDHNGSAKWQMCRLVILRHIEANYWRLLKWSNKFEGSFAKNQILFDLLEYHYQEGWCMFTRFKFGSNIKDLDTIENHIVLHFQAVIHP
ncbi:hypothetical protein BDR06DRAFT_971644 [Suillus hirtellus]|nr:hypothetical protein BDR06DRAFT_971644 [Suillus hirtellus]